MRSICGVIVVTICAWSASVAAYRTAGDLPETRSPDAVRWRSAEVGYRVDASALALDGSDVATAVRRAFSRWANIPCASVEFRDLGSGGDPVSGDRRNDIAFVGTEWAEFGFPPSAVGVTDTLYQALPDGGWEIVEADVWLNAWDFDWSAGFDDPSGRLRSVETAVLHEVGHMIGAAHPCELEPASGAPQCSGDEHRESAMYPLYSELGPALSADDQDAACFLYPSGVDTSEPGSPTAPEESECSSECCRDTPGPRVNCVPSGSSFGEPCVDGAGCASGLCVHDSEGSCTRECGAGCPSGYECAAVDGERVCVFAKQGGGCSAVARHNASPASAILLSLAIVRVGRRK